MVVINEDGIIEGGICDGIHHNRALREKGARIYLDELRIRNCVESNNGWHRIALLPRISEKEIYEIGASFGVEAKVGYMRFRDDIIESLFHENRPFRRAWLERWLGDISSFEFVSRPKDPSNALAIFDLLGGDTEAIYFGYALPHEDALYKKRKARGDFIA